MVSEHTTVLFSDHYDQPGAPGYYHKIVGATDNIGVFALTRAGISPDLAEVYPHVRCDSAATGPLSFHYEVDGKCVCGSDELPDPFTGDHVVLAEDLTMYYPVIEALPYGFIVYLELDEDEKEEHMIRRPYHTRTLQEMLRYLVEWDWAYRELGSTEEVAIVSHGMLDVMGFPDNLRQWVINQIPYEKLGRFLRGDSDANARTTEPIPELSMEINEWLVSQITKCRAFGGYDYEDVTADS